MGDEYSNYHSCLVIWHNFDTQKEARAGVIDMDELQLTNFASVKFVHRDAFLPPPNSINMERSQRKNLERRLSKPLVFGEMIEYDMRKDVDENNFITGFKRIKSIFETRTKNGVGQILVRGAVNPKDSSHFYNEFFTRIQIPDHLIGEATPNIFLEAWISLDLDRKAVCEEKFDSFHGVCPTERQYEIGYAPWNVNNSKYKVYQMPDSDEDDEIFASLVSTNVKKDNTPDLELYKRKAYMTGDRSFLLEEFPQYKCFLPLKKHEALKLGGIYQVDCIWHQFANIYIISSIVKSKQSETLRVDKEANMLTALVKAHDRYLGLFRAGDSRFGVVDDPDRLLSLLHLTEYREDAIPVLLTDGRPTRCGLMRFRIKGIVNNKDVSRLLDGEKSVIRSNGIILDKGNVFSAEHGPIPIVIDDTTTSPPPGSRISFVANFNSGDNKFHVQMCNEKPEPVATSQLFIDDSSTNKHATAFKTKVKTCVGEKPVDKLFYSEDFGVLEDDAGLLILDKKMPHAKVYTIWVMKTIRKGSAAPRSYFDIVGVGEEPPKTYGNQSELIIEEDLERQEKCRKIVVETLKKNEEVRLAPKRKSCSMLSGKYTSSDLSTAIRSLSTTDGYPQRSDSKMSDDQKSILSSANSSVMQQSVFNEQIYVSTEEEDSSVNVSVQTCEGGIDPRRHPSRRQDAPTFVGPVDAPPNYEGRRFDVVETLSRLKAHVFHGPNCGRKCSRTCPYINELSRLIIDAHGFWREVCDYYPKIADYVIVALGSRHD